MDLSKNLYKLIGVDKEEVLQLQFKISESENLNNFTKKDYELIYKLSGGDLLNPSATRALVMLYSKEKIDAWNDYRSRDSFINFLLCNQLKIVRFVILNLKILLQIIIKSIVQKNVQEKIKLSESVN